ncbi:MAG TPA: cellulase family glycosylhydrolase, partial [Candidatus Eisenbacteria bacterium]|nr:cellulase family glycosylhydrolase [Candidatus Eisenbacteria bacterium]
MRALFILDYSHSLYEKVVTSPHPFTGQPQETLASPQHEDSIAAFARWAAASAKHFHSHHIIWEIWNEPNIQFWSPKPDAAQYTALALATCKAVRAAEPNATVVGPASSRFPWEFLETFLKSGALDYLDAVTVHPYRDKSKPPETAAADYEKLRLMIDRYSPESKKGHIPILSGEWGYSSHQNGVSQDTQAAFAARQQLSNLLNGVPLSIWYDWKNDGEDPKENEHNFGTVSYDLQKKPAYGAIQKFTHELGGYGIARRVSLESEKDYVLICTNTAGVQKLVAWTTGENHSCQVPLRPKDSQSTAENKQRLPFSPINFDSLGVELKVEPQYISLKGNFRN